MTQSYVEAATLEHLALALPGWGAPGQLFLGRHNAKPKPLKSSAAEAAARGKRPQQVFERLAVSPATISTIATDIGMGRHNTSVLLCRLFRYGHVTRTRIEFEPGKGRETERWLWMLPNTATTPAPENHHA